MTTYKEIKGTQIEVVSSDPSNPVEGQVWYNSTDQAVKGQSVTTAGSWATVTSLNTARRTPGAGGTSTAALAAEVTVVLRITVIQKLLMEPIGLK